MGQEFPDNTQGSAPENLSPDLQKQLDETAHKERLTSDQTVGFLGLSFVQAMVKGNAEGRPDKTFFIDKEGHYIEVIERDDVPRHTRGSLIGRTVQDVLPSPTGDQVLTLIHQALDQFEPEHMLFPLHMLNGAQAMVKIWILPIAPNLVTIWAWDQYTA